MNSRQVLRVIHGAWNLHQNGEWSFERKKNDLGFPAIVRTSETFDSLERIVRSLYNLAIETPISMTYRLPEWMLIPDGNNTPPITILKTPDVQVMIALRAWFADLTLCVTIGAEDVAHYQFFCRSDFNIGSSSYKFGNGNEDPSFEGFEVKKIKHLEYEVRNKEGYPFYVDISKRFCSCFEFQLLEITCQHAVAAVIVAKIKVDSLVAEEYTKNATFAAYVGSVAPVIDTDDIIELSGFEVKKIKHLEHEVRNKEGYSFHVDISKRFCSCFEFQLLEIPCQHAIAAAIIAKIKVNSLVAEEYTKNATVSAYVGSVTPVIDTDDIIELTGQFSELDMLPPSTRHPPGRPRKKSFLSSGEVRRKPSDLGYTVLVKLNESFKDLETIIRDRYKLKPETPLTMAYHPPEWMLEPDGTRRPLITVSTTSEVEAFGNRNSHCRFLFKLGNYENPSFLEVPDIC
ncbi:hypothetical protein DY000_02061215 [Brassica cretica]|uniref:SWIM-type domain-containing protein n=1 Tax=Brassica cretica TaxID=69181 RepID=A0ABQ7AR71_BRACR|nr:hypothetical protein DY000_02061215 [Brassica cretica]